MPFSNTHTYSMRKVQLSRASEQAYQVILGLFCAACTAYAVLQSQELPPTAREATLVNFQPVVPPLVMLWLWGARVKGFKAGGVEYELCFAVKDRKHLMPGEAIQGLALVLGSITAVLAALMCKLAALQAYAYTEMVPIVLHISLLAVAFLPWPMPYPSSRLFFLHTCQRVILPLQAVSWADFLLADMLCSLSKSCADLSRAVCWLATGPVMQNLVIPSYRPAAVCSPTAAPQIVALCLPYMIRFIQCFIVHRTTGKSAQLFNAAKYFSGFPMLLLSVMEHEAHAANRHFPFRGTWLLACASNGLFSYYWDVEQDWKIPWCSRIWAKAQQKQPARQGGMSPQSPSTLTSRRTAALPPPNVAQLLEGTSTSALSSPVSMTRKQAVTGCLPLLQPETLHAPRSWYVWALCTNLVLRSLWIHRLVGNLEANEGLALMLVLAEVWRRHQWVLIRIKAELNSVASTCSIGPTSPNIRKEGQSMVWDRSYQGWGSIGGPRGKDDGEGVNGGLSQIVDEHVLHHRHGFLQDSTGGAHSDKHAAQGQVPLLLSSPRGPGQPPLLKLLPQQQAIQQQPNIEINFIATRTIRPGGLLDLCAPGAQPVAQNMELAGRRATLSIVNPHFLLEGSNMHLVLTMQ